MPLMPLRRCMIVAAVACLLTAAPGIRAAELLELRNREDIPAAPEVQTPPSVAAPPAQEAVPEKQDAAPPSLESFLLTTPADEPEEKPAQVEKKPEKQPEKPRAQAPKEPPKQPDKKSLKPEDKQPKTAEAPKKGAPLKIPEEAKKTGKLDFLEGCWVGTRPEYGSKRMITERFCFGKDGSGRRFIEDPGHAGRCEGPTRAIMNQGGVLRMKSEKMKCSDTSSKWAASEMTCKGEGDQTPCTWVFSGGLLGFVGARQSYEIRFVRE